MYLKGFAISWSSKGIKFCQNYIRILSKLVFELRQREKYEGWKLQKDIQLWLYFNACMCTWSRKTCLFSVGFKGRNVRCFFVHYCHGLYMLYFAKLIEVEH